ncbi:MAG: sulfate adenylyltransferase subunit 2 [Exilibacterium sp.]
MSTEFNLTHLQQLEAESIHIIREVAAEFENPVMLYSIGKDSAVMMHLTLKAFYPGKPPFPLLHVDTTWKFREMIEFRDKRVKELGWDLLVHINQEGVDMGISWDPKNQRPELWSIYNGKVDKGESIRVFPLSNWTELDIWQYIHLESIPIVPLYFAAERPVVERDGVLIMVDDERMSIEPGEKIENKMVRFRTLGCYPLTGAVESTATTLPEIIQEMLLTKTSERQGRVIDHDSAGSMEKKKQEGYF